MKIVQLIKQDARAIRINRIINAFIYGVGLVGLLLVLNGVHRMHDASIWHF